MTTKQRTGLQKELSDWLDEDVIEFIKRRHDLQGATYRKIAAELSESGWDIKIATVSSWISYERNR
jgi:hypothetical protein